MGCGSSGNKPSKYVIKKEADGGEVGNNMQQWAIGQPLDVQDKEDEVEYGVPMHPNTQTNDKNDK